MSRKSREYKVKLVEFYSKKGKYPSYKMPLSTYKRIKRMVQRQKKDWIKFRRSQRRGAILVTSIDCDEYRIYK